MDFDSRPSSTAPPEGNAMHPTSHPQTSQQKTANLMDDDGDVSHMNNQMSKMNMHEAMVPDGKKPLKRTDTETSEPDVFVDAES